MSDPNRGGEGGQSSDISPDLFVESSEQRILREEFERLEVWNKSQIDDFNPNVDAWVTDITLKTSFREYERNDRPLTETKRMAMLTNVGLSDISLSDGDPRIIKYVCFSDGSSDVVWLLERADGTNIPVWTRRKSTVRHNAIKHVRLLSNERAEQTKKWLEDSVDEQKINEQLIDELELYGETDKFYDVELDAKRGMLEYLAWIRALPEVELDVDS